MEGGTGPSGSRYPWSQRYVFADDSSIFTALRTASMSSLRIRPAMSLKDLPMPRPRAWRPIMLTAARTACRTSERATRRRHVGERGDLARYSTQAHVVVGGSPPLRGEHCSRSAPPQRASTTECALVVGHRLPVSRGLMTCGPPCPLRI